MFPLLMKFFLLILFLFVVVVFFSLIEASKETRDSKELYGETGIAAYE